jgi:hypothetical protein
VAWLIDGSFALELPINILSISGKTAVNDPGDLGKYVNGKSLDKTAINDSGKYVNGKSLGKTAINDSGKYVNGKTLGKTAINDLGDSGKKLIENMLMGNP